ncbi:Ger(x)C family spore germination protein [Virgibacillus doumboii]|uniref:Ger(x)C family spore germination protein n=1 Tax=Virgibacillus doumboii TaxID=2697503 RepID=UPI0013DFAC33|nr:Ger(x)C family spore germination protein [Virgibacillus doumboii]
MVKRKWIYLVQALLMLLLLAGCWDRVEIEDRGFIVGIAVDLPEESEKENAVTITNQLAVPAGLSGQTQGGSASKAFANLTVTGNSLIAIQGEMSTITSRSPFLPHMQLIAVSGELAKTKLFANVMDLFIRDHEMRRGVSVIIIDGKAKEAFEIKPENEQLPVMHIQSIIDNSFKNSEVARQLRLGDLHESLLANSSYVVPRMVKKGDRLDYEGIAVFQGHTDLMVGTLNAEETKGYNLITGKIDGGTLETKVDGEQITLEMMSIKSSMEISEKSKAKVGVSIKVEVEGKISETFGNNSLTSNRKLRDIEKQAENKIEKLMNRSIKKAQDELKADIFGIGRTLQNHHYDFWQKVKKDWDKGKNIFSDSSIHVTAGVKVRSMGATDETQN